MTVEIAAIAPLCVVMLQKLQEPEDWLVLYIVSAHQHSQGGRAIVLTKRSAAFCPTISEDQTSFGFPSLTTSENDALKLTPDTTSAQVWSCEMFQELWSKAWGWATKWAKETTPCQQEAGYGIRPRRTIWEWEDWHGILEGVAGTDLVVTNKIRTSDEIVEVWDFDERSARNGQARKPGQAHGGGEARHPVTQNSGFKTGSFLVGRAST